MVHLSDRHPSLGSPFGGSSDALLIVNNSGVIESANVAAERLFRREPGSLDGVLIAHLVPEPERRDHQSLVSKFFDDPEAGRLGSRTLTAERSDGSEFQADILFFPHSHNGVPSLLVAVLDLTAKIAVENAIETVRSIQERVESKEEPLSNEEYRRLIHRVCEVSLQALPTTTESRQNRDDFLLGYVASEAPSYQKRSEHFFNSIPLPLWEADYSEVALWFDELRKDGVSNLGDYFDSYPESLSQGIAMVQVTRQNVTAERISLHVRKTGLLNPARIPSSLQAILRDRLIGIFDGVRTIVSNISKDDSEEGETRFIATSWVSVHLDGEPDLTSVFSTMTDLRPLNRLAEERRSALEHFEGVFENAAAGIMLLGPEGEILRANRAFTDMLGYGREDLDGVHLSAITPNEHIDDIVQYIEPLLADGRGVAVFEHPFRCRTGEIRWGRVSLRSVDSGTEPRSPTIAVTMDITELREERLARLNAEAGLKKRNSELESFAFIAAHDLSEPLRKIRVFGERLSDRTRDDLDERSQDYLDRMVSAAERMQNLIDGLLAYSSITTSGNEFTTVDLGEVAQQVVADLQVAISETGATIEIDDLPSIQGDATLLGQLLQNLLTNSLKYRSLARPLVISITGRRDDDFGEFVVSDNGLGFEQDQSKRIFGLFERLGTGRRVKGSGMGLAIVKKIVEHHGGEICSNSSPDEGAAFTVRLPLAEEGGTHS